MKLAGTLCILLAVFCLASPVLAQEYAPQTSGDPSVELEDLKLLLKPLTQDELTGEIDAWLALVKGKVTQISAAEIAKRKSEDGAGGEQLDELRKERNDLIKRLEAVIAETKKKGGDPSVVATYVSAVAPTMTEGIDVKDPNKILSQVVGWLKDPEGGLLLAKNLAFFFLILLAFRILANILGKITKKAVSKWKNASGLLKDFFVNTVRKLVFFIGLITALSVLGIDVGPFVAGIGAVGFILGFALQGTLSNFASGVMILLYRPYDIGEVVSVAGVTGKVDAMSLVSTTVKTPDNQTVVVPNGSIWGDVITNVTGSDTRRVDMVFGIGYEDDIAKAQGILEQILSGHEKVLATPAPVIKLHELADSSVNFVVRPWSKTSDYWDVYWDVTRAVKEKFDAEQISIPYPQQDVHMHQVNV